MKHILIIYHSQSGHTEAMAHLVLEGAEQIPSTEVKLIRAYDVALDDVLWADGIIFGSPEYFGYMCGALKDFFDRMYWPANPHNLKTPFSAFVNASIYGEDAAAKIERIAGHFGFEKTAETLICRDYLSKGDKKKCREVGRKMAEMLIKPIP